MKPKKFVTDFSKLSEPLYREHLASLICEIWGADGGEGVHCGLLRCHALCCFSGCHHLEGTYRLHLRSYRYVATFNKTQWDNFWLHVLCAVLQLSLYRSNDPYEWMSRKMYLLHRNAPFDARCLWPQPLTINITATPPPLLHANRVMYWL
jgi:hypothetical protein